MRASDILKAYESGLITADEAAEQAQVESVDALYERASAVRPWASDARGPMTAGGIK